MGPKARRIRTLELVEQHGKWSSILREGRLEDRPLLSEEGVMRLRPSKEKPTLLFDELQHLS